MRIWTKRLWFFLFLGVLVYLALVLLPYVAHKPVSPQAKKRLDSLDFYAETPGTERVAYVDDNTEALLYRLKLMDTAKEELILSTFDFHSDEAGKDVLSSLLSAAGRGVKVRVLVDGFSGLMDFQGNPWFQALAAHENVSVKIYNPIRLLKPWKIQARLHDKYVIADDTMYLLGGRNTRNLFLGDYVEAKNIDRELFLYETGENPASSLQQLRAYFESVWALPDSRPYVCKRQTKKVLACEEELLSRQDALRSLYPEAFSEWDFYGRTMDANRVTLLQNPIEAENKEPWMWEALCGLMDGGEPVLIYTPYIICGEEMYQGLTGIAGGGGFSRDVGIADGGGEAGNADTSRAGMESGGRRVEILTNAVLSGANPWGCTDYLNQKERILDTGVTVYEYYGTHSSHTKAYLIGDRMSVVGSYNLDMRSTYQDTELMLAVDSPELNRIIRREAEADKERSLAVAKGKPDSPGAAYAPKEIGPWKMGFYSVLRVLIPPFRRFL